MDLHGCFIERIKNIAALITILVCTSIISSAGENYLIWAYDLRHHYDGLSKTQKEWRSTISHEGIVNASFFTGNRKPIPPYSSETHTYPIYKKIKWWFIESVDTLGLTPSFSLTFPKFYLKSPTDVQYLDTKFKVSVCPPLIVDGIDVDKKSIYGIGGRRFAHRNCRRTIIGKTRTGLMFIFVGNGNLFTVRSKLKKKIIDIEWLANLDGGSSSFLTLNSNFIIKNKTKIPSVISYSIYSVENLK